MDAADVVGDVLREAAVDREPGGPVSLVHAAVVEAGRVGAGEAVEAAAAAVVDVDRDPVADRDLVDGAAGAHHRAGPLVAGRERPERRLAGQGDVLKPHVGPAGAAHGDLHQHLGGAHRRHRLLHDLQPARRREHGGPHRRRHRSELAGDPRPVAHAGASLDSASQRRKSSASTTGSSRKKGVESWVVSTWTRISSGPSVVARPGERVAQVLGRVHLARTCPAARQRHGHQVHVGRRGRLAAGGQVDPVVEHVHDQAARLEVANGADHAEPHQQRAVALDDQRLAVSADPERHAEAPGDGLPHAVEVDQVVRLAAGHGEHLAGRATEGQDHRVVGEGTVELGQHLVTN